MSTPTAAVVAYRWGDTLYPTVVAEVAGVRWLMMLSLDGMSDLYSDRSRSCKTPEATPARREAMLDLSLEKEILHQLAKLALEQQQQVLHFARALARSKPLGVPGKELQRFAGTIALDDLHTIAQAIEDGCEQVNLHEW